MQSFPITQGVPGFKFSGISAGLKKDGLKDLGLILCDTPAPAAAVFTRNRVKAAPVLISAKNVRNHTIQAILVNSGNANACTGQAGINAALKTTTALADRIGINPALVAPFSTGVIGVPFPANKIINHLPGLLQNAGPKNSPDFARSILTTDTVVKTSTCRETINQETIRILGMAKGSGMIMPDMATMLAFIVTDISIDKNLLSPLLKEINEETFNRISVDGDMSTNDAVIVLSSCRSKQQITRTNTKAFHTFQKLLRRVMRELATMIVKDGEGATKLIHIKVIHAASRADAKKAAMQVANSNLVKTAFFGEDFNWGRILGALGSAGARFDMNRVALSFNDIPAVKNGQGIGENIPKLKKTVRKKEIDLLIDLKAGKENCTVMTCDLSYDYVRINADYTT